MEGDFVKACEMLKGLYPEQMFNAKDLATLNTLSFRKPLAEWNIDDSPVKGNTFYKYKNIADALYNI